MRILFLVATKQHKVTAGSRIRYDRLKTKSAYFDVAIQSMDEVTEADFAACSVCVFSKTYSVSAISIAKILRARGIVVGVDLFDDYFSQDDDPRLTRFRTWLRRFGPVFQFALCSTATMQRVVREQVPGLPVHILPDPYPKIDAQTVSASLARSLERTRETGVIEVLWFGIGANPFFPVGIQDLCAYSWSLAELAAGRFDVHLTILTDTNSLNPANLARISRLPVPYTIEAWTEEREAIALDQALVAFLPVNGQSFSRAKSPNRALTAISGGAQVLSPGFPLYLDLDTAVYTQASELLADIERGACRISSDTLGEITQVVERISDLENVLVSLFLFLTRQHRVGGGTQDSRGLRPRTQAVLYALDPERATVPATRAAGILSVRSPYTRGEQAFDVRLDHVGGRVLAVWVKPGLVPYLAEPLQSGLSEPEDFKKVRMVRLAAHEMLLLDAALPVLPSEPHQILYETEAYYSALSNLMHVFRRAFPSLEIHVAGLSSYPAIGKAQGAGAS